MRVIGEVAVMSKEREFDIEWKIYNFDSLSELSYNSPHFFLEGESWTLQILPNGCGFKGTKGFIDLRLIKLSCGPSMIVKFSFSFKNVNGKKDLEKHNTGVFKGISSHFVGRFLSRSGFARRKSEFLASDSLTVVCTLKKFKSIGIAGDSANAGCSSIKRSLDDDIISSRKKECSNESIKCPECSTLIDLQICYESETASEKVDKKTESSMMPLKYKALEDYKKLLLKQEDCDVIIKVKEQEFPAHRVILKARSPVLASAFRNDMKEKMTGIMDIEDCEPSHFSDFLYFLYCSEVENLTVKNVFSLFTLADKYDVPDLRNICMDFIKLNLSIDTFCNTITLALLHSEIELIKLSTEFFAKNMKKIIVTAEWQSFIIKNPLQSNEILIKALECDNNKQCFISINVKKSSDFVTLK